MTRNYAVTFDDAAPLPAFTGQPRSLAQPPPARLDRMGWCLLASVSFSLVLLGCLGFRWWQLARRVRSASAGEEFGDALPRARHRAGLRPGVRLKLVDAPMSPAVCGLFRPVILLPRLLVERLSPEQLHAVLLHEAMHLRRKDIWVNCAQSLLQILYWWHPLVWLANARIRHVREQAVDDAVMVALADDAETYAPTLLEVARLALHRPRLSLGLVGILESRSSLRQRIERLINLPAPRKAGLTLVSFCGIFVFSAVALPMGQAPVPAEKETLPASAVAAPPPPVQHSNPVPVLVTAEIYQIPPEHFGTLISRLHFSAGLADGAGCWSVSSEEYSQLLGDLRRSGLTPLRRPRILTSSGKEADFFVGNDASAMEFDCLPVVSGKTVNLSIHGDMTDRTKDVPATNRFDISASISNRGGMVFQVPHDSSNSVCFVSVEIITNDSVASPRPTPPETVQSEIEKYGRIEMPGADQRQKTNRSPRQASIQSKLDRIRLAQISFDGLSLQEVTRWMTQASKQGDPQGVGVTFSCATNSVFTQWPDINSVVIKIPSLTNIRLADLLDAIVLTADRPLQYSIRGDGVVFSGRNSANELAQRAFKVNTNLFFINLRRQAKPAVFPPSTDSGASVNAALRQLFGDAGVDMKSPRKAVFYSQKTGWLFVKATVADMDLIEKVVVELNNATPGGAPPLFTKPEIHLKARFLEVPRPTLDGFEKFLNGTNLADGKLEGILSVPNAKNILQALQSRRAEVLGEPEITVANGRRLQMRATQIVTIVTNLAWQANSTNQASPGIMPQTEALETGPVLDATATILADDYTIHLSVKASLTEFLGYDQPETGITNQYISYTATSPVVWPDVQVRSQSTDANLDDGQTILLSLDQSEQLRFGASSSARDAVVAKDIQANLKRNGEKPIIVFITATLVDQAGNRIHSDNDPAFPPDQIPAQPVQSK